MELKVDDRPGEEKRNILKHDKLEGKLGPTTTSGSWHVHRWLTEAAMSKPNQFSAYISIAGAATCVLFCVFFCFSRHDKRTVGSWPSLWPVVCPSRLHVVTGRENMSQSVYWPHALLVSSRRHCCLWLHRCKYFCSPVVLENDVYAKPRGWIFKAD